ncbi:transcriptional regulator [Amycolatopsis sp. NPDC005232]|uniref:transcriptional regulator n=1 Tax=Amycolatopsis sp. NPDC005232 TaxID=3157027 RepID=UPI00339F86A2
MMARFVHVEGSTDGIDPALVPPVRLLIVATLADQQWHEFATVRESLRLSPAALSKQLATLRKAGFLETRHTTDGRRSAWRLSASGADQLDQHVAALGRVVATVREIVSAARAREQR